MPAFVHRGPYQRLPSGAIDCWVYAPEIGPGDGGFHPITLSQSDILTASRWATVTALPEVEDLSEEEVAARARNGMAMTKGDFITALMNAEWISEAEAIAWAETGTAPGSLGLSAAGRIAFGQATTIHRLDSVVAEIGSAHTATEIDAIFGG
jgi:hypothetical protein